MFGFFDKCPQEYGVTSGTSALFHWLTEWYQYHSGFITIALWYSLRTGIVISPEVPLLLRSVIVILDILSIHKELRVDLPMSVKNYVGILMRLHGNCIFLLVRWPFHYVNIANPLAREILTSSEVFFEFCFQGFEVLSYRSFTCLVRVTPRYLLVFVAIVKGVASLISFPGSLSLV